MVEDAKVTINGQEFNAVSGSNLKFDIVSIEEMFDLLPDKVIKNQTFVCSACGRNDSEDFIYNLKIEAFNFERSFGNCRKNYKVYYYCSDYRLPEDKKYIGTAAGIGFKTLSEAVKDVYVALRMEVKAGV